MKTSQWVQILTSDLENQSNHDLEVSCDIDLVQIKILVMSKSSVVTYM